MNVDALVVTGVTKTPRPRAASRLHGIAGLALCLLLAACGGETAQSPAASVEPPKKLRVAVARFQAETCTFCPGGDTDIDRWTRLRPVLHGEDVLTADSYVRGFTQQAREFGDVELLPLQSPYDVFGSSSHSWNTENAFNHFTDGIIADLKAALPVDGVYLALHGAMAVRNVARPEAEIARRVREVVGPDVPIIGTFDLHGNEDEAFLRHANMAFVTKRYPHYDAHLQGERAARLMRRIIRKDYSATTAVRKPGIITPTVMQWTGQSPAMDIMERARRWEARERDAYVSVFFGFPWSDVPDVGATVIAMTNNDPALAEEIVEDMSAYMWRVREAFAHRQYPMPNAAVSQTLAAVAAGETPVVLGDYSDRSGDATFLLAEMLAQGVSNMLFGTLRDEHALAKLQEDNAQPGDKVTMALGGFAGPASGEPVHIDGTLAWRGAAMGYEHVAAIEFGNHNMLILTPAYEQVLYPEEMAIGPIKPDDYEVFVVKSRVHFRRGFDETGYAKTIIVVDAPGPFVGTTRLDALDYQHAPIRELYPFNE
jgi:microcystin degradation protein MlrC